jgi:hypothetical protein
MLIDGAYFGFTLEDPLRFGQKVYGDTCIPAGVYEIKVTYSPRFKRDMPQILRVPKYTGVRIHGGNSHKNTLGCPLVAANRFLGDFEQGSKIWGSLEKSLTRKLKASKDKKHYIEIINSAQMLDMT